MNLDQDLPIILDLNQQFGIQRSLQKIKRVIWKGILSNRIKLVVGARSSFTYLLET